MESACAKQLDELLREDVQGIVDRETILFDQLVRPYGDSLVLFGAGQLGRKILRVLRLAGIEPLAFADNDPKLWDRTIADAKVLSPAKAAEQFGSRAAFVVTIWSAHGSFLGVEKQLGQLGCRKVVSCVSLQWKYHEQLLPHFCFDLPHLTFQNPAALRQAFALWADEESRACFVAFLRWRLWLDYHGLPQPVDFYPEDVVKLTADYGFVDCGAFDGDTTIDFVNRRGSAFREIIAIEPDPVNHRKLSDSVSGLDGSIRQRITLLRSAVGEKSGKIAFNCCGSMASSVTTTGNMSVDCLALDDILSPELAYFIKVDVEGAELSVCAGARRTIEKGKSIWAITLEHKYDDLWRIPLSIQSISKEYAFYLRSHGSEGIDLTCYAVPIAAVIPNRQDRPPRL